MSCCRLHVLQVSPVQHFTKPPPRFTEASMVKALEEAGVGRPSTYAPTIRLLQVGLKAWLAQSVCVSVSVVSLSCTFVSNDWAVGGASECGPAFNILINHPAAAGGAEHCGFVPVFITSHYIAFTTHG
jgi:hypothetical protein